MDNAKDYINHIASEKVSLQTRAQLYRNLLKQEVGFFDKTKSGEILRRLNTVTNEIGDVWRNVEDTICNVCEMSKYKCRLSFHETCFHVRLCHIRKFMWRLTWLKCALYVNQFKTCVVLAYVECKNVTGGTWNTKIWLVYIESPPDGLENRG